MGQCSMTVALPVLSTCGLETCILPTAILSTHTGGFQKPSVHHLSEDVDFFWQHWKQENITFDAIYTGYLGSVAAVESTIQIIDALLAPGGIVIVDPAMADHGKLYSGFDDAYVQAMAKLCAKADILLPNITEAAMLAGVAYRDQIDAEYVAQLLSNLRNSCTILTGVAYAEGQTGIMVKKDDCLWHYTHRKVEKNYHGTGDLFASAFTGALLQGKSVEESVKIAADFTLLSIQKTYEDPAHWYGVKFETALPELIRMLQS